MAHAARTLWMIWAAVGGLGLVVCLMAYGRWSGWWIGPDGNAADAVRWTLGATAVAAILVTLAATYVIAQRAST